MTLKALPKSLARISNIEFLTFALENHFKATFQWDINIDKRLIIRICLFSNMF